MLDRDCLQLGGQREDALDHVVPWGCRGLKRRPWPLLGRADVLHAVCGEKVVDKPSGYRASAEKQAAFEVAFESVSGEVGAADQGGAAVNDKQFGVHRGAAPCAGQQYRRAGRFGNGSLCPVNCGLSTLRSSSSAISTPLAADFVVSIHRHLAAADQP